MASDRIGPGVFKRAQQQRSPSSAPAQSCSPEQLALELEHREQQRKTAEGRARRDEVQELLALWSSYVGIPHELLVKQMPQFFKDWGFEALRDAILEVAAEAKKDPLMPSWPRMQQLVHLLRRRRRESAR